MSSGLFVGALLLFSLSIFVPGFLISWAATGAKRASCLFALPVGLGMLATLAFVCGFLSIQWSPGILVVLFLLSALLAAIRVFVRPSSCQCAQFEARFPLARKDLVLLGISIGLFGFVALHQWQATIGDLGMISTYRDAVFHFPALSVVTESGNVNPFNALNSLYSADGSKDVYYPVFWHALTAPLVPWLGLAHATAVSTAFIALILWPVSLSIIVWVLQPGKSMTFFATPAVASMVIAFPTIILHTNAMYPFSFALALLPAALGLFLVALLMAQWSWWALAIVTTVGILGAQPTTVAFVLVLLVAFTLVWLVRRLNPLWRKSSPGMRLAIAGGIFLVVLGVVGLLYLFSQTSLVLRLGSFSRPTVGYREELIKLFSNYQSVDAFVFLRIMWWVLALIGALRLLRTEVGKVAVVSSFLYFLVLIAAIGPDSWLRMLTGFWYKDELRIEAFNYIWFVAFVVVGFTYIYQLLSGRISSLRKHEFQRLVVGCLVLLLLMAPFMKRDTNLKNGYIAGSHSAESELNGGAQ